MGKREFLKGTVELVVLLLLKKKDMYGYEIITGLKKTSPEMLSVGAGTIYPVLMRMQKAGLIKDRWVKVGVKRKRHYYHLTKKGREKLKEDCSIWDQMTKDVSKVIRATS